jgi:glycosyltransferase involved in cell wall biosynthesis
VKIALFGGVFESPMGGYALSAPENVLRRFLTEAGHEVIPMSVARTTSLAVRADAYHVNHFGPAGYWLAIAGARPLVFTSHNPFLASGKREESRLEHGLQALLLRSADAIVALAAREAEELAAIFGIPRNRFVVIPNGLDLELYGQGSERSGAPLRLLTVGQLAPFKGHRVLLDALPRLVARFPGLRLELASHRADLRPELEAQAKRLGVADVLEFTGPFDTAGLVKRYRDCDVYIQPSFAECFPVTILEAMACGRPVVATDVGGVREEVGDAGLIVPPGDAGALGNALERLLGDEQERRMRATAALDLVRTRYDGKVVAARHVELYESLAGQSRYPSRARRVAAAAALAAYGRRDTISRALPARIKRRATDA